MRKIAALLLGMLSLGATLVSAQQLSLRVEVLPGQPGRLSIHAAGPPSSKWSFPDSYAGVLGLANRVDKFQLLDEQGRELPVRKLAPGQFACDEPASKFKYEIQIAPPVRASDAPLVSWIDSERGVLLFADFLPVQSDPRGNGNSRVTGRLILPSGWTASSTDLKGEEFDIANPDRASFVLGKSLRTVARLFRNTQLTFIDDSEWAFTGAEAIDSALPILETHAKVAGEIPCERTEVVLLPFPQAVPPNKWSAQTRGCTVTLLMGKVPSKVGALSQLGLALTHEMFHLWIPNGIPLSGDYDWFYEGFTMYQAARVGVQLGMLTFQQFLNAIGDAYAGSSSAGIQGVSLIEASRRRWTTGASAVYSKAMVVAFLYDLNLRLQSKGKRSLDDVYRKLLDKNFRRPGSEGELDGNTTVMSALRAELAGLDLVDRFVTRPATINLQDELGPFGLTVETLGLRSHVFVGEHLTGRQRDLLKQLGYNEPRRR